MCVYRLFPQDCLFFPLSSLSPLFFPPFFFFSPLLFVLLPTTFCSSSFFRHVAWSVCPFSLSLSSELRTRPSTCPATIMELEDSICRATVEIEYYKHFVGSKRWPKSLYCPPRNILRPGENRASVKRPLSSYQARFHRLHVFACL